MDTISRQAYTPAPELSFITKAARWTGIGLLRLVIILMVDLLALPVVLLPLASSTPAPVWILLVGLDLLLVAGWVKFGWRAKSMAVVLIGFLLVAAAAVVASQVFASTPPILGDDGKALPGSIASLEQVELNGSQQWISIRGKDVGNPVLLFLAGGPGGSQMTTARHELSALEDHYIVVQWDQPGSGKSYNAVPKSMLTPERYIEDGLALVKMLRQRFGVEKVTVVGESWGSVLGVWMVQRSPEMFEAFVGAAQMVDFDENDLMCYEFALQWAAERGDTRKIATLKAQGPPPYYGNDVAQKQLTYLADTFAYMNQDVNIINGFNTPRDLGSPEYGLADKVAWALGPVFTLNAVYPQLWDVDLRAQAAELEVPVYFFTGRHDVNAPPALVEEYYQVLDAPHKEIVYFEHSGHNPWVSEADLFVEELLARVPRTSEAATAAVE